MRAMLVPLMLAALGSLAGAAQERGLPISVPDARAGPSPRAPLVTITIAFSLAFTGPVEVLRLNRSSATDPWQLTDITHTLADDGRIAARGPAGVDALLFVRQPGRTGYLLDGPFRWPAQPANYYVIGTLRRTVRGRLARAGAGPLEWVTAREGVPGDAWPLCAWLTDREWECVGVPLKEPGVLLSSASGHLVYFESTGAVDDSAVEIAAARAAHWGRLLAIGFRDTAVRAPTPISVSARRVRVPSTRPRSLRLDAERDSRVAVTRLGPQVFWLAGTQVAEGGWIEITATGRAAVRLDTRDVANAPADLPLRVDMDPAAALSGTVTADPGTPVKDAVVSIYRFTAEPGNSNKAPPKRILLAETRTSEDGEFRFEGLGSERYELVAIHTMYGRVERVVEPSGQEIQLALHRPSYAIGRVLRNGAPIAGVAVAVVPDLAAYASSDDMTQYRGGEATSGEDGRFSVALAFRGRSEVRVGDSHTGVRRIALGAAESLPPIVDLGTIDLAPPPAVTFVLEGSDGCNLLLIGPAGRAGMSVTTARRLGPAMFEARLVEPGRWMIVAMCAGQERGVLPGSIDVLASGPDVSVHLTWPARAP